jgi:hypothetical protein
MVWFLLCLLPTRAYAYALDSINISSSSAGKGSASAFREGANLKPRPLLCAADFAGAKPGSSNPVTQSLLDFFDDIVEGARDGSRQRAAQLQVCAWFL